MCGGADSKTQYDARHRLKLPQHIPCDRERATCRTVLRITQAEQTGVGSDQRTERASLQPQAKTTVRPDLQAGSD